MPQGVGVAGGLPEAAGIQREGPVFHFPSALTLTMGDLGEGAGKEGHAGTPCSVSLAGRLATWRSELSPLTGRLDNRGGLRVVWGIS